MKRTRKTEDSPVVDLHPSEWTHEKHREPVFTAEGRIALWMFLWAFPVSALVSLLMFGEFPDWLSWLIPLKIGDGFGIPGALAVVAAFLIHAIARDALESRRRRRRR